MKKKINEAQLKAIISEAIMDTLSNSLKGGFREGSPASIKDVIEGNHWQIANVQKPDANTRIIKVYSDYNPMGNRMTEDELVEDLNIYFQHNNKSMRASVVPGQGGRGVSIKISRV